MALLWLRLAVFLYGIAALAVLPAALYDRPRWRHIALPAALAGAFFHFVSITETLYAAHRALPVDTHETLSLLGLILAAGFLVLAARYKTVAFGIFLLPIAVLLTIVPAFHPGHETLVSPRFGDQARTGWLILHIVLLLIAYAALFLSLIASVLYLVQERRLKQKRVPRPSSSKYAARIRAWLPPLDTLDQIALNSLRFGLPCMTAGLLIGSVLALETTGPAFFADPKVLLSIAMWVAYVLMIFIRRHSGLRGRRAVYLSSFVFLVVLAVWAANSLSTVHSFRTP
ncbi:cytochrome C biogenesis protein [Granulicella sp. 5B5]|uniref:cytochrome C assembly family protein n=1 Tax=Granulicella sp. 5B5 TaxID=1617967 RepID=UPI0015F645FC|nr:cytochrome c biogenesis protein CcsA [Granulicella sp. 5B5]QMV19919.1 cytochrome C biogenesis protein [Granulicella sp. 5B5]